MFSELFVAVLSGYLSLLFITATSIMMLARKRLAGGGAKRRRNYFTKVHVALAVLGGVFLIMHADYFLRVPVASLGIALGYASTAAAVVVWFTGFSFLERPSSSLLYHGSLSLFAVALMVVHAVVLGPGFSLQVSEILLVIVAAVSLVRASQHAQRLLSARKKEAAPSI